MPFVANTPESRMGRTDSKNPNSTCRGITSSGRPCRRPLAADPATLSPPSRRPRTPDPRDESLYCWQHREQASLPGPRATATPILETRPRTSLDTLADRLGLVDLQEKEKRKGDRRRRDTRPNGRHSTGGSPPRKHTPNKDREKSSLKFCLCFTIPLDEAPEPAPARPQPRPVQQRPSASVPGGPGRKPKLPHLEPSSAASPAKSSRRSNASETARLKDLIPNDVDTATASALLAELARPLAESEEPGYIYMFWLTPETKGAKGAAGAPADAARAMLAPPSPSPRSRRASDVVSPYADTSRGGDKKTMVLKIGRAANVQRRMNQWQRQCGRDVEVLRYYPYVSSSAAPDAATTPPKMVPHVKRVERLVHIELSGRGLRADRGTCGACGREHREWFEVEASRAAVRQVDGVIRRWVGFSVESDASLGG
ncbi:hypothetical protein ACO1O0_003643 [Amphichorda felina]